MNSLRAALILLVACTGVDPADTDPFTPPPVDPPIEVVDMASYLAACEAELGPLPALTCADAVEIPITVTDAGGTRAVSSLTELEDGFRCDRSSIGGCAPFTRIGALTNDQGTNIVFGCRNYGEDPAFDQLNVIMSSPVTGATCFLSTKHRDEEYGDGEQIPRPGSAEDLAWFPDRPFWYTLDDLKGSACMDCHDNDAILHNPWIRQVDVLPEGDPLGPYWLVAHDVLKSGGLPGWQTPRTLVHPATAPCRACHRLAERRSCVLAMEATGRRPRGLTTQHFQANYPENRWMSTFDHEELLTSWPTSGDWEATWGAAADAIEACCSEDPPAGCFE